VSCVGWRSFVLIVGVSCLLCSLGRDARRLDLSPCNTTCMPQYVPNCERWVELTSGKIGNDAPGAGRRIYRRRLDTLGSAQASVRSLPVASVRIFNTGCSTGCEWELSQAPKQQCWPYAWAHGPTGGMHSYGWFQKSDREKPHRGRTNQQTLMKIPCNRPATTALPQL